MPFSISIIFDILDLLLLLYFSYHVALVFFSCLVIFVGIPDIVTLTWLGASFFLGKPIFSIILDFMLGTVSFLRNSLILLRHAFNSTGSEITFSPGQMHCPP